MAASSPPAAFWISRITSRVVLGITGSKQRPQLGLECDRLLFFLARQPAKLGGKIGIRMGELLGFGSIRLGRFPSLEQIDDGSQFGVASTELGKPAGIGRRHLLLHLAEAQRQRFEARRSRP